MRKFMWIILVPHSDNEGKKFPIEHHWAWDAFVKNITGGLTIHRVAKGEWINDDGIIYKDKMIPVHISCTEAEIEKIADFTNNHYKQEAVTYYAISDYVVIRRKSDTAQYPTQNDIEKIKDKIKYGILGPQIGDVPEK